MNKKIEEFSMQLQEELKQSALPGESSIGLYVYDITANRNRTVEEGKLIYFGAEEPVARFLVRDGKVYVTAVDDELPLLYKEKEYPKKSGVEVHPESIFEIGGHKFVVNDLREMDIKTAKNMLGKKLVEKTVSSRQKKLNQYHEELEEVKEQLDLIQSKTAEINKQIVYREKRHDHLAGLQNEYLELKAKLKKVHDEVQTVTREVQELDEVDYDSMLDELQESHDEYNGYYSELDENIEKLENEINKRIQTQIVKEESKKEELSALELEEQELLKKLQELEQKKKSIK